WRSSERRRPAYPGEEHSVSTLSFTGRRAVALLGIVLSAAALLAEPPVRPFADVTQAVGLAGNNGGEAAWADFDGDGLLDLYVGGYENWPAEEFPDVILMNRGGGRFVETWRQKKILRARGVTAADFDEDGDLDVFVSNYRLQPNLLWQNDG